MTALRVIADDLPANAARPAFDRSHGAAWLLVLPTALGMLAFILGPCLLVLAMALSDWQLGATTAHFVGLDNFREVLGDRVFWLSARHTIVYSLVVTVISVILGLILALLIEASPLGRAFFRSVFFLPVVSTTVAMAVVWEFVLHPTLGPVNVALAQLGFARLGFLGDVTLVLGTLAAIGIWENAGFNMILFLAGLKMIPRDLYQAAAVDGAEYPWERFWTVTFPLLGPTLLFVVVVSLIRSFKVFDTVAAITQGGPRRASEVLLFTIYQEGFNFFRIGYASALTILFLAVLVTITLIQVRLLDRRVHY